MNKNEYDQEQEYITKTGNVFVVRRGMVYLNEEPVIGAPQLRWLYRNPLVNLRGFRGIAAKITDRPQPIDLHQCSELHAAYLTDVARGAKFITLFYRLSGTNVFWFECSNADTVVFDSFDHPVRKPGVFTKRLRLEEDLNEQAAVVLARRYGPDWMQKAPEELVPLERQGGRTDGNAL